MNVVLYQWRPDLFVLAGNEHCRDAYQLQVVLCDAFLLQVAVDQVDSQEQAFNLEFELEVDLNDPVNKDASHSFADVLLELHVLDSRLVVELCLEILVKYALLVLYHTLRILFVSCITCLNGFGQVATDALLELLADFPHLKLEENFGVNLFQGLVQELFVLLQRGIVA